MIARVVETPIGPVRVAVDGGHVIRVTLPPLYPEDVPEGDDPVLDAAADQLQAFFMGRRRAFDLPLRPAGTPFQTRVWEALLSIPYGETSSYGQIAKALGSPGSSRAVGAANGSNPIAIVIPCHRVIGTDGSLTGYGGGMDAKRWLLAHEARHGGLFAS